jgi:hypothetical protein
MSSFSITQGGHLPTYVALHAIAHYDVNMKLQILTSVLDEAEEFYSVPAIYAECVRRSTVNRLFTRAEIDQDA